jgi:O-antigen ligase
VTCGVAVLFTYSRMSILTFGFVALMQVFVSQILRRKSILFASVAVLAGMMWFFAAGTRDLEGLSSDQQHRLGSIVAIFKGDIDSRVTGGRYELAMAGVTEWLKSPILGNGLTSQRALPGTNLGPHNTFVLVLGESGIVPGAMLMLFFVLFGWQAWRCPVRPVRTLVLGFWIIFFLHTLTSHGSFVEKNHALMLGVSFGLLVAAREMQRRGAARPAMFVPRLAPVR